MKRIVLVAVVTFFGLMACSQQPDGSNPAEPIVAETAAATDSGAEVEDALAAEQATAESDEQPELVEESAAEEEVAENQPIILAQAEAPTAPAEWKYKEGQHYVKMVPTQPTVGGADKIEVAEFFWYGCAHCYDFETYINRWLETKPANVRFVRVPAVWNELVRLHAQLYYTEEVLVKNGKIADPEQFRAAVFAEYHRRGNRLASQDAILALFEKHGVSAEDFANTWSSFEVSQKLRVAQDLARRYSLASVPAIVVNGKYRTGAGEAGGYPALMELIDELILRESVR